MDTFSAVTWNVYTFTPLDRLEPHLERELVRGVSLFFMQEARENPREMSAWLASFGLQTYANKQYRIAWTPDQWMGIRFTPEKLSQTAFFSKGSKTPVYSEGARVILCDYEGRSLDNVCYHTPAHVQGEQKMDDVPRRSVALAETMANLGHMAEDTECRGFLAAGDDNWDEDTGFQDPEMTKFLIGEATGLRLLQSGDPTFGNREIDDFRIRRVALGGGIKPVKGAVWVEQGGGAERPAHKIHGRTFRWVG